MARGGGLSATHRCQRCSQRKCNIVRLDFVRHRALQICIRLLSLRLNALHSCARVAMSTCAAWMRATRAALVGADPDALDRNGISVSVSARQIVIAGGGAIFVDADRIERLDWYDHRAMQVCVGLQSRGLGALLHVADVRVARFCSFHVVVLRASFCIRLSVVVARCAAHVRDSAALEWLSRAVDDCF
jgi:hypothetical protein